MKIALIVASLIVAVIVGLIVNERNASMAAHEKDVQNLHRVVDSWRGQTYKQNITEQGK